MRAARSAETTRIRVDPGKLELPVHLHVENSRDLRGQGNNRLRRRHLCACHASCSAGASTAWTWRKRRPTTALGSRPWRRHQSSDAARLAAARCGPDQQPGRPRREGRRVRTHGHSHAEQPFAEDHEQPIAGALGAAVQQLTRRQDVAGCRLGEEMGRRSRPCSGQEQAARLWWSRAASVVGCGERI
jgi:hypothetical protein